MAPTPSNRLPSQTCGHHPCQHQCSAQPVANFPCQILDLLPPPFFPPSPLFYRGPVSFPEGVIETAGKDPGAWDASHHQRSCPANACPSEQLSLGLLAREAVILGGQEGTGQRGSGWSWRVCCLCPSRPSGLGAQLCPCPGVAQLPAWHRGPLLGLWLGHEPVCSTAPSLIAQSRAGAHLD